MIAVAPLADQYATLAGMLVALGIIALLWRGPGALVVMAMCAGACAFGMARYVESEGNTINTDASPITGPVLIGAVLGLALHVKFGKRSA